MHRVLKSGFSRGLLVLLLLGVGAMEGRPASAQTYNYHVYVPLASRSGAPGAAPVRHYTIVKSYPHDPAAYTEGLFYQGNYLYEGTGSQYQPADVRKVQLTTGQVVQSAPVPAQYYGEGIAPFGSSIYELTWTSYVYFKYDIATLSQTGPFPLTPKTQGWGLTQDGVRFIMSDGTSRIYFRDPNTFGGHGFISVTDAGTPVTQINELEYINGQIWANIWLTDRIAVISPQDGHVIEWIDLTGLRALQGPAVMNNPNAVLNGIAWDPSGTGHLYVTGKLWPNLYEIQVVP